MASTPKATSRKTVWMKSGTDRTPTLGAATGGGASLLLTGRWGIPRENPTQFRIAFQEFNSSRIESSMRRIEIPAGPCTPPDEVCEDVLPGSHAGLSHPCPSRQDRFGAGDDLRGD